MNLDHRLLYAGVFFLAMGATVLVAQAGLLRADDIAAALPLWPFVVIALGGFLLLRRTRFGIAGGMLAAATPGLLFGGLIVAAPGLPVGDCTDHGPVSLETRDGSFGSAGTVDLHLACGDVTIITAAGSGWQTRTGSSGARQPAVSFTADRLTIESMGRRSRFDLSTARDRWFVTLPTDPRLDLTAEVSAGRGTFDLAGARLGDARFTGNAADLSIHLENATVDRLSVDVNAAAASVRLPAGSDLAADITVNAGNVKLCTPDGLGVRIHETGTLAGFSHSGLVKVDGAWETPGYAAAAHHADVSVSANVGSVDVNPEGGCK